MKKCDAPLTVVTVVFVQDRGRGRDLRRGTDLVPLGQDEELRSGVGRNEVRIAHVAQRRGDGEPTREPIVVHRQRDVGTEGPPGEKDGDVARHVLGDGVDRRDGVVPFSVALVVGALATFDAAEVEPEARHAGIGQPGEQRGDHDRAHRPSVARMRMAQHRCRPGFAAAGRGELRLELDPVGSRDGQGLGRHRPQRRHLL